MNASGKKPRIRVLGENGMEDVEWDSLPDPDNDAYDLMHHFIPPRISPVALNIASKIIPSEYIIKHGGLHQLLAKRAEHVFKKMSASERSGCFGTLKYVFDFDKDGPVLKTIGLL